MAIVSALRKGGFNLYMRHGAASEGQDTFNAAQTPRWFDDCKLQRNLSALGQEQARKVGAALKQLNIRINVVKTSQFCRVRDTAYAMNLGPIEITEDLNHMMGQRTGFDTNSARYGQLAMLPPVGTNVLLISHTHGSPRGEERVMGQMQEAEIVVYQPDAKGLSIPVARIPLADWDVLIKLANP